MGENNMNELYLECLGKAESLVASYRNRYWAATDAVCGASSPPPPPPPDYGEATREGILADIESLPARKEIEAAAKMGQKGAVQVGDQSIDYDFTGIGDLDQQVTELQARRESADSMATMALDIQKRYGGEFLDEALGQIEKSDPVGFQVRQKLADKTLEQLEAGMTLTDEEQRFAQQSFRKASAARGGPMLGDAAAVGEMFQEFGMGRNLMNQRMNMARSYVGMPQTAQFGQTAGAQQGAAPFMPSGLQMGLGINPNAAATSAGFASNVYGTQGQIYGAQLANQSDPFGAILGGIAGMGMTALGGGIGGGMAGVKQAFLGYSKSGKPNTLP
tara:strand:- start:6084 stop:7079 length:996 start_codon:yes stop_codon:yes gene_type:complete